MTERERRRRRMRREKDDVADEMVGCVLAISSGNTRTPADAASFKSLPRAAHRWK